LTLRRHIMCMQAGEAALESAQQDALDKGRQLSEVTADLLRGESFSCHRMHSRSLGDCILRILPGLPLLVQQSVRSANKGPVWSDVGCKGYHVQQGCCAHKLTCALTMPCSASEG
jgi:hypothetical protein